MKDRVKRDRRTVQELMRGRHCKFCGGAEASRKDQVCIECRFHRFRELTMSGASSRPVQVPAIVLFDANGNVSARDVLYRPLARYSGRIERVKLRIVTDAPASCEFRIIPRRGVEMPSTRREFWCQAERDFVPAFRVLADLKLLAIPELNEQALAGGREGRGGRQQWAIRLRVLKDQPLGTAVVIRDLTHQSSVQTQWGIYGAARQLGFHCSVQRDIERNVYYAVKVAYVKRKPAIEPANGRGDGTSLRAGMRAQSASDETERDLLRS